MSITIYKQTDVDITIAVTGVVVGDITDMTITLEGPLEGTQVDHTFTMDDSDITITGSDVNLRIEDTELTTAGTYRVRIVATENGNLRGLTPDPNYLIVV